MGDCIGCLWTEKQRQNEIDRVSKLAKDYAVEHQKFMVVYFLPDKTVGFMDGREAKEKGITPIKYVSFMRGPADG